MPLITSTESTAAQGPKLIDPRTRFSDIEIKLPDNPTYPILQRDLPTQPDCGEESYIGRGRLNGRRALITGGDSGIGRAVAIAMAREGAKVAINYLPAEEPDAEDVFEILAKDGIKLIRLPGNLLDEDFCVELVQKAERALGGLDILVNNAGFMPAFSDDLDSYTTEQWDKVFRTNVYTGFWLTRAAIKCMPPGSSIVWTVSEIMYKPVPQLLDYGASKAAVGHMLQALATPLAKKGIRINGVAPSFTYTPLFVEGGLTQETLEQIYTIVPLGRIAQPVEMALMYVDLADATMTYTSGIICQMNGGHSAFSFG